MISEFVNHKNRALKQQWWLWQWEQQTSKRYTLASQQFCTRITPFCTWNFLTYKPVLWSTWMTTQKFSFSFSKHTVDAVLSDSTPVNFANFWQIKWNWIRQMKFEQCNFTFEVFYSVCCHPEILPPWQRDVTTSPLYLMALLPRSQECVIQDTPILFWRKRLRI